MIPPDQIKAAWGWIGIHPESVVETNAFGNLIVRDEEHAYWRICPEDLRCVVIAATDEDFRRLRADAAFIRDWEVTPWVQAAQDRFGALSPDRAYCLKLPSPLGGRYELANFETISRLELLSFSGDVGRQIHDLPDGSQIKLSIRD